MPARSPRSAKSQRQSTGGRNITSRMLQGERAQRHDSRLTTSRPRAEQIAATPRQLPSTRLGGGGNRVTCPATSLAPGRRRRRSRSRSRSRVLGVSLFLLILHLVLVFSVVVLVVSLKLVLLVSSSQLQPLRHVAQQHDGKGICHHNTPLVVVVVVVSVFVLLPRC